MGRTGMSKRELRRVEVLTRVPSEELKIVDATKLLALSYRQVKRIWAVTRRNAAKARRV